MRTWERASIQAGIVVAAVGLAEWVFQIAGESWIRVVLVLPLFPGALAGLALSGHGGNMAVAYLVSITVNAAIWLAFCFAARPLIKPVIRSSSAGASDRTDETLAP